MSFTSKRCKEMAKKLKPYEWIEDEMTTWRSEESRIITELPAKIKKRYYQRPVNYDDTVEIWSLENGQFVVYYSPTGTKFLYDSCDEAKDFRKSRVSHLIASYKAFGKGD